jgi:hypothetical protein
MRTPAHTLAVTLLLSALFATTLPASTSDLTGAWRSAPEETSLTTDFDVSVWGKNAKAVRTVELTVGAAGEATLTVTRKVVDARGRTVKGSTSVEQAQIVIGEAERSAATRSDLAVTVKNAERKYPDDPGSTWSLDGLKVGVATFSDTPGTIEVRFDTPEGRGSFWETLSRGRGTKR